MTHRRDGIDLNCKYCKMLDKIWIIALIGAGIFALIVDPRLLITFPVAIPLMYWFNRSILRNLPTAHGYLMGGSDE